jgi:molybdate transport system regulatory protein
MTRHNRHPRPDLELRVIMDGRVAIGPVQALLLEEIHSAGSIAAAQRRLGASYAHVWKLVAAMNEMFSPPLVDPLRGGARGGGAVLTHQGRKVLDAFRQLEVVSRTQGHSELLAIGRAAGHAVVKSQGA